MGQRNPIAKRLHTPVNRSQVAESTDNALDNVDLIDQSANGLLRHDLGEDFQIGDAVKYGDEEGMVKNPKAPQDTVGITIGGKYALVPEDDLELIEESLARMRELSK